jgi:hypothetical protein
MASRKASGDILRANSERSFMHLVITLAVAVGAALLIGCAEPVAPAAVNNTSPISRNRPPRQWPFPDSVGIPVSPIPPIYEEIPIDSLRLEP